MYLSNGGLCLKVPCYFILNLETRLREWQWVGLGVPNTVMSEASSPVAHLFSLIFGCRGEAHVYITQSETWEGLQHQSSWDSLVVGRWTHDRKVVSLSPSRSSRRICLSELTVSADSYVHSTPVLPRWHVKDPDHSAKSAGGRIHSRANEGVGWLCCPGLVWEPVSGKSPHTGHQETLSHSHLGSLTHYVLILASKVE